MLFLQKINSPPFFSQDGLSSLQALTLAHNRLEALESASLLPSRRSLRALSLSGNRLRSVPEGALEGMDKLASLALDGNELEELPG